MDGLVVAGPRDPTEVVVPDPASEALPPQATVVATEARTNPTASPRPAERRGRTRRESNGDAASASVSIRAEGRQPIGTLPAMTAMDAEAVYAFIAADGPGGAARTGKLATVRADGRPHVAPIWVAIDGEDLLFNTGRDTLKGKALRRDPRVAIAFDDETPPFAYAVVEGTVTITEDLDAMLQWATVIGSRYMGAERGEAFGKRNAVPGELLVRVTPTRVFGAFDIAD